MSLNYKDNIPRGVRRLRKERRWTQAQLARLLGLSQSRLSEIEHGKGSFTAEQFLLVLQTFNVPISYFVSTVGGSESSIQNTLARLGAHQLQEDKEILPSERIARVNDIIRETLVSAGSSRQIVSLAPILVANARGINLRGLSRQLYEIGLRNRLGWLAENVLYAVGVELQHISSKNWIRKCKQAEVILKSFLIFKAAQETEAEDILDSDIVSERTLEAVKKSRSNISKEWHIVTRIQPQDFIDALRSAHEKY